jgi:hypothetical protein
LIHQRTPVASVIQLIRDDKLGQWFFVIRRHRRQITIVFTNRNRARVDFPLPHHHTDAACFAVTDAKTQHLGVDFNIYPITNMATNSRTPTKPVKVFRLRGISASVFANIAKTNGRSVPFHKVSIQRTYKDGDDFKTTTNFGRDDLAIVQLLAQRAWEFILDAEAKRGDEEDDE